MPILLQEALAIELKQIKEDIKELSQDINKVKSFINSQQRKQYRKASFQQPIYQPPKQSTEKISKTKV